jgi:hypothetical protein
MNCTLPPTFTKNVKVGRPAGNIYAGLYFPMIVAGATFLIGSRTRTLG